MEWNEINPCDFTHTHTHVHKHTLSWKLNITNFYIWSVIKYNGHENNHHHHHHMINRFREWFCPIYFHVICVCVCVCLLILFSFYYFFLLLWQQQQQLVFDNMEIIIRNLLNLQIIFMMMIVILSSKQCSFTKDHKSIMISIHIPYSVCCVFPPPLQTWKKAKGKNLNKTWMMIMMMMMIQLFMFVINSLKNVYWMEK